MVKKKLVKLVVLAVPSAFKKGFEPHQAPS